MAKSIVIDQSYKKYTFSFELTKPQSNHFWELLIAGYCMSDRLAHGVANARLKRTDLLEVKRWRVLAKELSPLLAASKLQPIEKEKVDNTTD